MFRFVGLMPLVPSLIIFGAGACLLFYGKKNKSSALRVGGWVMTIGAVVIMVGALYLFTKNRGEEHHFMHDGCPMMEMMKAHGQGCGCMGGNMDMGKPMTPPPPMIQKKM